MSYNLKFMMRRTVRMSRRLLSSHLKTLLGVLLLAPVTLYADVLKVAGSTTIYPLVRTISAAYMAENPDVEIHVAAGGSDVGIDALIAGRVDIAASSRYFSDDELRRMVEAGIHLVPFRIAHDCIIPVVNRRNPVKDLSVRALQDIYRGKITNWDILGGENLSIHAISRRATSGTQDVWNSNILGGETPGRHVSRLESNHDVVAAVSRDRSAIGYIALGYLNAYVKPLSVNGDYGSSRLASNGKYYLSRPLFLFTRGWPERATLDFITYVLDPGKGQKIVDKTGYVPLY